MISLSHNNLKKLRFMKTIKILFYHKIKYLEQFNKLNNKK